jgi:CHAT domain-containing protein/tetratricopeptide (TPR) repeat protein
MPLLLPISLVRVETLADYDLFDSQEPMKHSRIAVASVAGAAGLAAALWLRLPATREADLRSALGSVLGGLRPVEGQLAGFAAAPFRPGAAVRKPGALGPALRSVARRLRRSRGPAALADAALLRIVQRRWQQAESLLAEAAGSRPRDARLVNDLAVVYLAQASADRDPERLLTALTTIERAGRLAPSLPAASFNRALILERLGLREHARSAWRQYLATGADPGWTAEAKSRLADLDAAAADSWETRRTELEQAMREGRTRRVAAILDRYTQSARTEVELAVLVGWAQAMRRGDESEAARRLRTAEAMIAGLQQISEDRLLGASLAAIQRSDGPRRDLLARAHQEFGEARALYKRDAFERARRRFASARDRFRAAGSPFWQWADFYQAACDYHAEKTGRAVAALTTVGRQAASQSNLNVAASAEWMLGLIALEQASPSRALDHFRQALPFFERSRELGNQGTVAALIANTLDYLGEPREAWIYDHRAIQATLAAGDREQMPRIYGAVARALLKRGEISAALAFQDEVVGFVRGLRDPLTMGEAFWWRAMILHEAGQDLEAAKNLAQARSWGDRIAHAPSRRRMLAGLEVLQGAVRRSSQPREATAALTRALSRYRRLGYSYLLVDVYWERALCFLALGEFDAAEKDLAAGIEEFERQRGRVHDLQQQAAYFERAARIVEAMISFQLDRRHDRDRAFDVAERSKARTLLDLSDRLGAAARPSSGRSAPVTAALLRRELPAGTFLAQYAVLPDRILVWTYWSGGGAFQEVRLNRHTLEELVDRFTATARGAATPGELAERSRPLFHLLVEPALAHVPEQASLVVVPDKALAAVPFQALQEPRTGRFLIDRNPLATAPSASLFLLSLERSGSRSWHGRPAALAVGNPAFDRSAHDRLASLPYGEDEARQVARHNPESLALVGADATVARFLSLVNRYDLVHFSSHAIRDAASPFDASLVLAPGADGSSGDLTAGKIRELRLTRPGLVVLSACGTASGPRRNLEGVSHLAGAFLAAGAPAVLANLWDVGDRSAQAFFALFYQELDAARDPLRALRATQLKMIRSPNPELRAPGAWAGFQLIGAAGSTGATPEGRHHG